MKKLMIFLGALICSMVMRSQDIYSRDTICDTMGMDNRQCFVRRQVPKPPGQGKVAKAIMELKEKMGVSVGRTRLYFGPVGKGVGLTLKF